MRKNPLPVKPTEAELQILQVLWSRNGGGATVRDVHADLGERTGYTSVLKLMQIMTDKGLLLRDGAQQGSTAHIYRAAHPEAATQRRLAADLMSRAFGGSARKLVAAALSSRRATAAELDEIRRLIDELKGDAS